jgi:H+/gluconate symporter-like permease
MLNAARVQGKPTMVIAITMAATIHATDIHSPPQTIQSTLSKKEKADIGNNPD